MQDFRKLRVWQKAQELVVEVYKCTSRFPKEELYGLTSQIRRAAVSIVANIAEGAGRGTDADFARFLQIATGSAFEVDALLTVAKDLQFASESDFCSLTMNLGELKRMLNSFLQTVKRSANTSRSGAKSQLPTATSQQPTANSQ